MTIFKYLICAFLDNYRFFFLNCLDTKSDTWDPLSETHSLINLFFRSSLQNYKHITCFKLSLIL